MTGPLARQERKTTKSTTELFSFEVLRVHVATQHSTAVLGRGCDRGHPSPAGLLSQTHGRHRPPDKPSPMCVCRHHRGCVAHLSSWQNIKGCASLVHGRTSLAASPKAVSHHLRHQDDSTQMAAWVSLLASSPSPPASIPDVAPCELSAPLPSAEPSPLSTHKVRCHCVPLTWCERPPQAVTMRQKATTGQCHKAEGHHRRLPSGKRPRARLSSCLGTNRHPHRTKTPPSILHSADTCQAVRIAIVMCGSQETSRLHGLHSHR